MEPVIKNFKRRDIIGGIAAGTIAGTLAGTLAGCAPTARLTGESAASDFSKAGIEYFDAEMHKIAEKDAKLEKLADGFSWAEGPVWDRKRGRLYFSDVPQNTVYSWNKNGGLQIFLKPSGLPAGANSSLFDSAGINGMWIGNDGNLLAASHGKRAVTQIDLAAKIETILADEYAGKPLNSPNDLVQDASGNIYFTDPPYGLKDGDRSPLKQQSHNGVYRLNPKGEITLIDALLTRPNGIALSPDENILYVAQSDPEQQIIKSYTNQRSGAVVDNGMFFDAQPLAGPNARGLPDGMCIAKTGHIFATGPGGVLVLTSAGKLIGRINTDKAAANCAFGGGGNMLYITASDALLRIPLKISGIGF